MRRIVRELGRGCTGSTATPRLADAVAELLACFPVYRSYLPDGPRAPRRGGRRGARSAGPTSPRRSTRCAPVLADAGHAGRAALPADQRHGDGQGRRGQRVLPLHPAHLAQRGRRRPGAVRASASTSSTPRMADRQARLAARDDHAVDPRHQARRGRPRPDRRARRGARRVGRARSTGCWRWRPLPDPAFAHLLWQAVVGAWPPTPTCERGCTPTPRRRRARPATSPRGPSPTRRSRRAVHAAVDAAFDDADVRRRARRAARPDRRRPAGRTRWPPSCVALTMPGRARRLPGQRAVGAVARRPRQPPPGRLRPARPRCSPRSTRGAARARRPGAAKLLVTVDRRCALRRDRPELFTTYAPVRRRRRRRPTTCVAFDRGGASPWRPGCPSGSRPRGGWGDTTLELPAGRLARRCSPARVRPTAPRLADAARRPTRSPCSSGRTDDDARATVRRLGPRRDPRCGCRSATPSSTMQPRPTAAGGPRPGPSPDPAQGDVDYGYLLDDARHARARPAVAAPAGRRARALAHLRRRAPSRGPTTPGPAASSPAP